MIRINKKLFDRDVERARKAYEKYDDLRDKYEYWQGEEPQEGLVPISNSPFYMTPDTPADPQDCNRYPDSPWCGGNPIDLRGLALDIDIVRDECNLGIQVGGTFGFIRLAPFQLVWRNPACEVYEEPEEQEDGEYQKSQKVQCSDGSFAKTYHPSKPLFPYLGADFVWRTKEWDYGSPIEVINQQLQEDAIRYREFILGNMRNAPLAYRGMSWELIESEWIGQPRDFIAVGFFDGQNKLLKSNTEASAEIKQFYFQIIGEWFVDGRWQPYRGNVPNSQWMITRFFGSPCEKLKFAPPPPKKDCCKMPCCPDNSSLEQLLRLVLKRIGTLPVALPNTILTKNGNQPSGAVQVDSLMKMLGWMTERLDEVVGEFEITVSIDDTDLTKEGNQSKTIRLPNLAEAVAEMYTLMLQSQVNSELILNIANRTLVESGQIKQQGFKDYRALMALIEYINFPYQDVKEEMPLTFSPGELTFDKMLKPITQQVDVIDYNDKHSFQEHLMNLLQGAAIVKAVHYRRLDKDDTKALGQLKDDLRSLLGDKTIIKDLQDHAEKIIKEYGKPTPEPS